jgi:hypothetical protein
VRDYKAHRVDVTQGEGHNVDFAWVMIKLGTTRNKEGTNWVLEDSFPRDPAAAASWASATLPITYQMSKREEDFKCAIRVFTAFHIIRFFFIVLLFYINV